MHENNCTLKGEKNWKYTVIGFLNYMYNIIIYLKIDSDFIFLMYMVNPRAIIKKVFKC